MSTSDAAVSSPATVERMASDDGLGLELTTSMVSPDASASDVRLRVAEPPSTHSDGDAKASDTLIAGAPKTAHASAKAFRTCCGLSIFCFATVFSISVAGLILSLRLWRPDVYLAATGVSSYGYTFGGAVHQGAGQWVTNKPPLPSPRSDMCAVALGDTIYLIGGSNATGYVLSDVIAFDAVSERYNTTPAAMPVPRYRFAAAAIGTRIYVVGGVSAYNGDPIASMDVYDTISNTWQTLPSMSMARSDLAAAAYNGVLYVFGGYGPGFDMSVSGRLVEAFDPSTSTWRAMANMPTARGDLVAVTYEEKIYVLGGWRDDDAVNGPGGDFQTAAEAFDPATNSWRVMANMLTRKGDTAVTTYRNSIFTVGGEVWSGKFVPCDWDATLTCKLNQVPTHDAVSFLPDVDPPTRAEFLGAGGVASSAGINGGMGVWISHAPMPGARFRFAAAASDVAQAIFVFGGTTYDANVVDTVTAFYDTHHPRVFLHYKDGSTWW